EFWASRKPTRSFGWNSNTPPMTIAIIACCISIQWLEMQQAMIAMDIGGVLDRKSTRLNSSHDQISYAVFCLKKKKKKTTVTQGAEAQSQEASRTSRRRTSQLHLRTP